MFRMPVPRLEQHQGLDEQGGQVTPQSSAWLLPVQSCACVFKVAVTHSFSFTIPFPLLNLLHQTFNCLRYGFCFKFYYWVYPSSRVSQGQGALSVLCLRQGYVFAEVREGFIKTLQPNLCPLQFVGMLRGPVMRWTWTLMVGFTPSLRTDEGLIVMFAMSSPTLCDVDLFWDCMSPLIQPRRWSVARLVLASSLMVGGFLSVLLYRFDLGMWPWCESRPVCCPDWLYQEWLLVLHTGFPISALTFFHLTKPCTCIFFFFFTYMMGKLCKMLLLA